MAHGALPPISEYGPPRCSSCGSPTTVCEADQRVVLIGEDPARSQAGSIHRKRERTSATPDRGAGAAQLSPSQLVHCRRCSGEDVNADVDTPKPEGYRLPRASPSRRRARAFAFGVALPLLLLHLLICIVLSARERSLRWEPRPHGAAAGSLEVPHIIHQMYKTLDLPAKWAGVPGQWARLHPPSEYTYILWTDESLRELIATDYEWLLPTYDAYPHPTQRWDASRYAVLHKYGGLYADLDLHPIASVDGLLRRQTLLLPHTPNIGLTNALLAATPRHPFLAFALQQLPAYASKWYHVTKHWAVLSSTGSTYIWAMHMRWAREHAGSSAASLVPSADWGKCSYCDGAQVGAHRDLGNPPPASPASPDDRDSGWISPLAHGQGSSWHSGDSRVVLFAFCHVHEAVALAVVWLTWRHTRKLRPTLCASLCLVLIVAVQRLLGLLLLETFLGRPLVWLLMS